MGESSRRRSVVAVLTLGVVAGCASSRPPERPSLSMALREDPAEIEVRSRDGLPLAQAELLRPDGTPIAATTISNSSPAPRRAGRQDGGGATADGPVAMGLALLAAIAFVADPAERAGAELVTSRAVIPLPDAAALRARPEAYQVRLVYGTPGRDARETILPAPRPD